MNKVIIWGLVIIGLLAGGSYLSNQLASGDPGIVEQNGIHWHPQVLLYSDDEPQTIPANVGLAVPGSHPENMHTHGDDNVLHMEIQGVVREKDLALQYFFDVWNKDLKSNEFGELKRVSVNGEDVDINEPIIMGDRDVVELWYETEKE